MAGEVVRIVGETTGYIYASGCVPEADEFQTAEFIHNLFSVVVEDSLPASGNNERVRPQILGERDPSNTDEPIWVDYV